MSSSTDAPVDSVTTNFVTIKQFGPLQQVQAAMRELKQSWSSVKEHTRWVEKQSPQSLETKSLNWETSALTVLSLEELLYEADKVIEKHIDPILQYKPGVDDDQLVESDTVMLLSRRVLPIAQACEPLLEQFSEPHSCRSGKSGRIHSEKPSNVTQRNMWTHLNAANLAAARVNELINGFYEAKKHVEAQKVAPSSTPGTELTKH